MERSKADTKERRPDRLSRPSLSVPNQNTILINIILYYFTRYGKRTLKFNEQKSKTDLNNKKITNHPPSPVKVSW